MPQLGRDIFTRRDVAGRLLQRLGQPAPELRGANPAQPTAPGAAAYLLARADSRLPQARVLTAGTDITLTDGGPGGLLTIDYSGSSGSIPTGLIAMWSGTLASIPSGWALCDGSGGTPDLRDKFVKGTAAGVDPGGTGGNLTHTHADHSYTPAGTINNHTQILGAPPLAGAITYCTGPQPHTFTGTAATLTHDSPNHEPPYYTVAYIIKT